MDAINSDDVGLPLPDVEGQTAFYGIDDPAWVALILRRLAAGDRVVVTRVGDLLITDG